MDELKAAAAKAKCGAVSLTSEGKCKTAATEAAILVTCKDLKSTAKTECRAAETAKEKPCLAAAADAKKKCDAAAGASYLVAGAAAMALVALF